MKTSAAALLAYGTAAVLGDDRDGAEQKPESSLRAEAHECRDIRSPNFAEPRRFPDCGHGRVIITTREDLCSYYIGHLDWISSQLEKPQQVSTRQVDQWRCV